MKKKPKLLIIAGYFPPVRVSVASIRPWNLAKYLAKSGWAVTVVTPEISAWADHNLDRMIEVQKEIESANINMIYTKLKLKYLYPGRFNVADSKLVWFFGGIMRVIFRKLGISDWIGWKTNALKACNNLAPEDVDLIFATGEPWVGFEIAYELGKKLDKPYIMDYRDLWTKSPYKANDNKTNMKLEDHLIRHSAGITVVSARMKESMQKTFNMDVPIQIITNGFDPEEFSDFTKASLNSKFKIVYAGTLFSPERSLDAVFQALKVCKQEIGEWEFHYFGPSGEEARREIEVHNLADYCTVHGNITRKQLYSEIKTADLSTVLHLNEQEYSTEQLGWIPGKIYELIGLESNYIAITPAESDLRKIIDLAGYGKYFNSNEINNIANYIVDVKNGIIPKRVAPELFSWESLSKKFEETFSRIIIKMDRNQNQEV